MWRAGQKIISWEQEIRLLWCLFSARKCVFKALYCVKFTWPILSKNVLLGCQEMRKVILQRLEMVLGQLQREGLKAKAEKCAFFQQQVSYLGHVISNQGVSTDPKKIEAVAGWQRPRHINEL